MGTPTIHLEGTRPRLSGRRGAILLVGPVLAAFAAPVLAALYAHLSVDVPGFGYIGALFPVLLGTTLGAVQLLATRFARCRSRRVIAVVGAASGALAVYAGWVAFSQFLLGPPGLRAATELFLRPDHVLWRAGEIHAGGWLPLFGWRLHGAALWGAWALESALVIGLAVGIPWRGLAEQVFCEPCLRWTQPRRVALRLAGEIDSERLAAIADRGVRALEPLQPVTEDDPHYVRLELRRCTRCGGAAAARISLVRRESAGGGLRERHQPLGGIQALSRATAERLEALASDV